MRRLAVLLALLALAGCGSHSDQSLGPLDDAMGYFSKDAPFVAAVETDPNGQQIKQLQTLSGRFPGAEILGSRLRTLTRFHNATWGRDVKPQLGAPLVIGLLRPAAGSAIPTAIVAAVRVKHPLRAKQTLLREPGFRGSGKSSGVRIYDNPTERRYVAV